MSSGRLGCPWGQVGVHPGGGVDVSGSLPWAVGIEGDFVHATGKLAVPGVASSE